MDRLSDDTEALLNRVAQGQDSAAQALLARHRRRLTVMVRLRMDNRLVARFDASDVVQETLAEASTKLPGFATTRPIAFYPWLRGIAWKRLIQLHRQHVSAQRRSVIREEAAVPLPDQSEILLADRFAASAGGVSGTALQNEVRDRVRSAVDQLPAVAREVIVLRHLEELSFKEIAEVMDIQLAAVYSRYRRAVERLAKLLKMEQ